MMYDIYNGYGTWGNGHMFGFGGGIMMLVFWVAVIAVVVWIVKYSKSKDSYMNTKENNNALELLKERYVKGEISKEEFESIKKDII